MVYSPFFLKIFKIWLIIFYIPPPIFRTSEHPWWVLTRDEGEGEGGVSIIFKKLLRLFSTFLKGHPQVAFSTALSFILNFKRYFNKV